jgi:hypothetical protein
LLALGGANALTTKRVSEMIGMHEVERHPTGVQGQLRINTRERRRDAELVVLPSQISNLPDLNGFLKYGKDWPLSKIKFDVRDYPVLSPAYIEAPSRGPLIDSEPAVAAALTMAPTTATAATPATNSGAELSSTPS